MDRNALGQRGESIFESAILKFDGPAPLFQPARLGGKWPVVDYAVELVNHPGMFFLVQVKASQRGYTKSGRLKIYAAKADIDALLSLPMPAYLVAIDEPDEKAYIIRPSSVKTFNSAATSHLIGETAVRLVLEEEVFKFWDRVGSASLAVGSTFLD